MKFLQQLVNLSESSDQPLYVGNDVIITGDVKFKGETGVIHAFSKDKKFVVVNLYNHGEHSFQVGDVSYNYDVELDDDEEEESSEFYVVFYDMDEERTWIGMVVQQDGHWKEKKYMGEPAYNWGGTYMSYLTPDQVMSWIHKDYRNGVEIKGPFDTAEEAEKYAEREFGPIAEGLKNKLVAAAFATAAALGGAGHTHAATANLSGYDTNYLQQVVDGKIQRPLVDINDAKAELQQRADGKAAPSPTKAASSVAGYSKDYLEKAANPNRTGRFLLSVEKAQELLSKVAESAVGTFAWTAFEEFQQLILDQDAHDDSMHAISAVQFMTRTHDDWERKGWEQLAAEILAYAEAHPNKVHSGNAMEVAIAELKEFVTKKQHTQVAEAKTLAKQVKIVKGPFAGKTGWIREIQHGAFKGAPKSFFIDLDDGTQANNIPAEAIRVIKEDSDADLPREVDLFVEPFQASFNERNHPSALDALEHAAAMTRQDETVTAQKIVKFFKDHSDHWVLDDSAVEIAVKDLEEWLQKPMKESSTGEYTQTASWTADGQTHKRWDKDHSEGGAADRHQSSIQLWQEKGKEPVYHASHRVEKGYWTNQSSRQSPTTITHKSTHSTLDSAKAALEKHTTELYKKEQGVSEAGPFSYGQKAPRKGTVAYNAAQSRKAIDKQPAIEPLDQMVGNATIMPDYEAIAAKHLKDSKSALSTPAQKDYAEKMHKRAIEASKMSDSAAAKKHYMGVAENETTSIWKKAVK